MEKVILIHKLIKLNMKPCKSLPQFNNMSQKTSLKEQTVSKETYLNFVTEKDAQLQ